MKVFYSVLATVAIFVAVVFFYLKPSHSDLTSKRNMNDSSSHEKNLILTDFKSGNADSLKGTDRSNYDLMPVLDQNVLKTMLIPEHFKNIDQGYLFSFDHNYVNKLGIGSKLDIKMLKLDINRQAEITTIEQIDNDIKRYRGVFSAYPSDSNYFTITQSIHDQYAIIKVFTDKGTVIAEIKDGIGLASSAVDLKDDTIVAHKH